MTSRPRECSKILLRRPILEPKSGPRTGPLQFDPNGDDPGPARVCAASQSRLCTTQPPTHYLLQILLACYTDNASHISSSPPVLPKRWIIVGSANGLVFMIGSDSGLVWRADLEGVISYLSISTINIGDALTAATNLRK
ncbi:hypothetical protein KSP40_PGU010455 [Platanthera guangdongensis]|uniref:Uncharacterized protein n=1 Tax=Platanthera guangdongensis TaxID=2320717 RepID=A0ABR2N218_9ASPA